MSDMNSYIKFLFFFVLPMAVHLQRNTFKIYIIIEQHISRQKKNNYNIHSKAYTRSLQFCD